MRPPHQQRNGTTPRAQAFDLCEPPRASGSPPNVIVVHAGRETIATNQDTIANDCKSVRIELLCGTRWPLAGKTMRGVVRLPAWSRRAALSLPRLSCSLANWRAGLDRRAPLQTIAPPRAGCAGLVVVFSAPQYNSAVLFQPRCRREGGGTSFPPRGELFRRAAAKWPATSSAMREDRTDGGNPMRLRAAVSFRPLEPAPRLGIGCPAPDGLHAIFIF